MVTKTNYRIVYIGLDPGCIFLYTIHMDNRQRKIAGGANFLVVLWTVTSIFRLSLTVNENPIGALLTTDLFAIIIPLMFLTVLNVFIGITLFVPQRKSYMWLMSVVIVCATLVALNTFQLKIDDLLEPASTEIVWEF